MGQHVEPLPPVDPIPTDKALPTVSLIVVTYQSSDYIVPCLAAVESQAYPRLQVIVVDNASTDGSAALVRRHFPAARVIESVRNLGFAGGVLKATEFATGDMLALLNPDTVVLPGWLRALVETLVRDPRIGIAGCKIYEPDRLTLQHAGGLFRPNALTDHRGRSESDHGQYDQVEEVPYVTAAALALRRDVIARCGLFDPGYYPAYFEEADLCVRARRAGFKVVYVPSARLVHYECASTGKSSAAYAYNYHRNRIRFVLKTYAAWEVLLDFVPSELAWLRRHLPPGSLRPVLRAYMANLVRLPATIRARGRTAHV